MHMLKDLTAYQKTGFWLAVVTKGDKIKVVSAAKKPELALQEAQKRGFEDATLMKSARRYAAWIPAL